MGREADYADFAKFYDHYLPRVLGFAQRATRNSTAAERLTEAILTEALLAGTQLRPGSAADAAVLEAARRVGVRDKTGTNSRSSGENC
jgi:DNA-directed RNA polymerase specialized sigma24 family protein